MKDINWNRIWQESGFGDGRNNNVEFWDEHAANFRKKVIGKDPYVEQFYEFAEIMPGETLFDMGCGSGVLAIPFAAKGHEVYAADFSQNMLDQMMKEAEAEGVDDKIHPIQLDWNEDWSLRDLPLCDVALSSRSMFFKDLTSSLIKLESVAARRVCMGAWDSPGFGYDRRLAKYIGYERPDHSVHYIIMNELMDRDVFPELMYIKCPHRAMKFKTKEDALTTLKAAFTRGLTSEQEKLFYEYCEENLKYTIVDENGTMYHFNNEVKNDPSERCGKYAGPAQDMMGSREFWQINNKKLSTIAFIRWDKKTVYDD